MMMTFIKLSHSSSLSIGQWVFLWGLPFCWHILLLEYFEKVTILLTDWFWANVRSMHLLILQRINHITYGVVIVIGVSNSIEIKCHAL